MATTFVVAGVVAAVLRVIFQNVSRSIVVVCPIVGIVVVGVVVPVRHLGSQVTERWVHGEFTELRIVRHVVVRVGTGPSDLAASTAQNTPRHGGVAVILSTLW